MMMSTGLERVIEAAPPIKYWQDGQMIFVDANSITPEILDSVSAGLFGAYSNSGAHEDVSGIDGCVKRNLLKPYDVALYDMYRKAEKAAQYMRLKGLSSLSSLFGFRTKPVIFPRRNESFQIPLGAIVYSTNPKFPRTGKAAKRNFTVNVHSVSKGYYNDYHAPDGIGWHSGEVRWAGAGGYWCWVKVDELAKH